MRRLWSPAARVNSCANRHSSKCQSLARAQWIEHRTAEILDSEYFHVVFTLPADILAVDLQNKPQVYGILFRATAETYAPSPPMRTATTASEKPARWAWRHPRARRKRVGVSWDGHRVHGWSDSPPAGQGSCTVFKREGESVWELWNSAFCAVVHDGTMAHRRRTTAQSCCRKSCSRTRNSA
jgi:hypothetical protein